MTWISLKEIRPNKNIWYDWLISYIPELVAKTLGGFMEWIISLFNTSTPKQSVYGREKRLSKPKTQNKISNRFISRKKKKKLKIE